MSAEVVAHLHPPRLPEAFTATGPADWLLAFALGLGLAALVLWMLGPVLRPRVRPRPLREQLHEAAGLPPGDAMLALARLARQQGRPLTEAERQALYSPDPGDQAAALRARLERGRPA